MPIPAPAPGCLYSRRVNAEFNWWLLIVGLVVGAGLVWLVLADARRREVDVTERERESEARWIAETLAADGARVDEMTVLDVLRLHADYLAAPPPDEPVIDDGEGHPVAVDRSDLPERLRRAPMAHHAPADDGDVARAGGGSPG